jgi:hypothetical protein
MSTPEPTDPLARHAQVVEALGRSVLDGPGVLEPETRRAAAAGEGVPERFAAYVETIHRHAYRVTDGVVAGLLEDGASEDEVFEMTVAAAFGAARERFDAGLRALREAKALPDVGGA